MGVCTVRMSDQTETIPAGCWPTRVMAPVRVRPERRRGFLVMWFSGCAVLGLVIGTWAIPVAENTGRIPSFGVPHPEPGPTIGVSHK